MMALWDIVLKLGDGSWLAGILTLPFAINGLILVVKGTFTLFDKFDEKYDIKSNFMVGIIGVVLILSYLALAIAVKRLL